MYCPKCGAKVLDEAAFCQNCGAALSDATAIKQREEAAPPLNPMQANKTETDASKKKMSLKVPLIGIAVVLIAVIAFIALNRDGKVDYVATVRAYQPYADSQGLPYSCGEVFDQYISDADWYIRKDSDVTFVDISGTANGSNKELTVTIQVKPEGDHVKMAPTSVKLDGNELTDTENTFFAFFVAYAENDEDLSHIDELISEVNLALRVGELAGTFADESSGISFNYPAWWVTLDTPSEYSIVEIISPRNNANHTTDLQVTQSLDSNPFGVFTGDEATVESAVNEYHEFLGYEDVMLGEVPAKALMYQTAGLNGNDIVLQLYYTIGGDVYQVSCSYAESTSPIYGPIFQAIMESCTVTVASNNTGLRLTDAHMAYSEKVQELVSEDSDLQFDLIDLTGSDMPELIADHNGYFLQVFGWKDGGVVMLGEEYWPYGAAGNDGYEYLPGGNVIRCCNSDYAGAVQYENYYNINSANELSPLPMEVLCIRYFIDVNGNGWPDDSEPYTEEPIYYVGDAEVSKEVYESNQVQGEFQWISGDMSAEEILSQLGTS